MDSAQIHLFGKVSGGGLIVLPLTFSFSGTFCTCLSILTENTNSLFTVREVLFKTSI